MRTVQTNGQAFDFPHIMLVEQKSISSNVKQIKTCAYHLGKLQSNNPGYKYTFIKYLTHNDKCEICNKSK